MLNRYIITTFLLLSIYSLAGARTSIDLQITLSNESKLIGKYLRSNTGRPIKAFTAIPYAKPPVGSLRFKAPEPIEKWDGEYKAVNDGPECIQRNAFVHSYIDEGTEDCLVLNVYVPHSFEGNVSNLAVLVYFHGGGFLAGSGIKTLYDPTYFLDHDIVLVTANYRVGPLGFLSTEDASCPGNFGLKDQAMVLKWIQQNIQRFGGDPDSVTICGASAGGASVTYLMMSPLTDSLYSKGIAMSGTNLAPWAQPAHRGVAKKRAKYFAEYFNCYSPNDWPKTIECLRHVPAANISVAFYDFFEFDTDPMVLFQPVVEPDVPGAFITKHPRDERAETSSKIPFMTGITHDEGLMKSLPIVNIPGLFEEFSADLKRVLSISLYYDHHSLSVQDTITRKIDDFYFGNNFSKDKFTNLTTLFGDGWFLDAMDSYLRMRLSHRDAAPTYVYLLTHKASASFTEIFNGDPETFYGVSHADEQLYFFPKREKLFSNSLPTKEDDEMRKSLIQMWVDFARTGNPTPESSNLPKWVEAKEFPLNYYRLGNLNYDGKPMFGMERHGIFEERTKFWREIEAFQPSAQS
ncbi:venom carboxylesterase-6-like [Contarinia nasturtii]|uniref:venom carboxylesterase-6-like n=1 Tax=Contarinia nasturtii TaxID=265458 RepID=UPI0012D408F4|nr:venom carboxylesterase-6-like [Contarinia nasturtii]